VSGKAGVILVVTVGVVLAVGTGLGRAAGGGSPPMRDHGRGHWFHRACSIPAAAVAQCDAQVVTDAGGTPLASPSPPAGAYGPAQFHTGYSLPTVSAAATAPTIAIVDAFDDPNAEADLAVYRSNFGLPECSTANGCFRKVNQKGEQGNYPIPNAGWASEESLDVDMVSAGCPLCHIDLVEADDNSFKNLGRAEDTAVHRGAAAVSNSYGTSPPGNFLGNLYRKQYDHPGTIILASAGDGAYGSALPATYPTVVSVGGTSLRRISSGRGFSETVWHGTGSGCNPKQTKPRWQKTPGCHGRMMNDVSAVADPSTGVAVYDTYNARGWEVFGGTSVSSPLVGSVYGLAGDASQHNAARSLYATGASLYDVTSGTNGTCAPAPAYFCTGEVGYDGPTGNGTPNGTSAF
jgi:subtilase family serine protease